MTSPHIAKHRVDGVDHDAKFTDLGLLEHCRPYGLTAEQIQAFFPGRFTEEFLREHYDAEPERLGGGERVRRVDGAGTWIDCGEFSVVGDILVREDLSEDLVADLHPNPIVAFIDRAWGAVRGWHLGYRRLDSLHQAGKPRPLTPILCQLEEDGHSRVLERVDGHWEIPVRPVRHDGHRFVFRLPRLTLMRAP